MRGAFRAAVAAGTLLVAVAAASGVSGAKAAAAPTSPRVRVRMGTDVVGRPLRLDGSGTRAARRGDRLLFRWRVVSKPRGSRVTLTDSHRAVAHLVADRMGRYAVQLLVIERRAGRTVGSDAAEVSVAPAPAMRAASSGNSPGACAARDQNGNVVDPMGCPIQTITSSGGIQVGDASYPKEGDWVRLVVLDPTQLTPLNGANGQSFNADQTQELLDALKGISKDDIVVLSGQGISSKLSNAQSQALTTAFQKLGGTLSTQGATYEGAGSLASGQWSLIGHNGLTSGLAEQNLDTTEAGISGFLGGSQGAAGSLNGYMQIVKTFSYQYVSPEYVPIDTSAPGSTTTENVISVAGKPYSSENLTSEGASEGIQMLVLGPNSAKPILNATYLVRDSSGKLITYQVGDFQRQLAAYVRPQTTHPPIVVVQTFGKLDNQGLEPLADAQDENGGKPVSWVQDTFPNAGQTGGDSQHFDYYGWCGFGTWKDGQSSGWMDGYPCGQVDSQGEWHNLFPNDPTGLGPSCASDAYCSVTQELGELAGMSARNEVANLGYQQSGDNPLQPAPEGLSFIGSARPYNYDQQELQTGADGERTIAVLRRSRQAQWEPVGSSPGCAPTSSAGTCSLQSSRTDPFDASQMWKVTFGTSPQSWPLEGPAGSSLANASDYIVNQLFPGDGYSDVRQAYVPQISQDWDSKRSDLEHDMPYPTSMRSRFSRADFDELKAQLEKEMGYISDVKTMIKNYESVFQQSQDNEYVNFNTILNGGVDGDGNKVQGILPQVFADQQRAYEQEQVTVREGPTLGSSLYFAADAIEFFSPEAAPVGLPLSLFAGAYDFFSELYSSSQNNGSATQPSDEPQQITDKASEIGADLDERYQGIEDTLEHFELLFVSDWGRLQAAETQSQGNWSLDDGSNAKKLLVQSLATAGESMAYEALMPVAYDQWVISPYWTYPLGEGQDDNEAVDPTQKPGPQGYLCTTGGTGNDQSAIRPFESFPASSMGWVRWEGDNQPNSYRNHFTGRVLVSKADPLQLYDSGLSVGSDLAGFPGVGQAGAAPDQTITDKLFSPPSLADQPNDPSGLSLSRADFFGMSSWLTPRLQCGVPYFDQPN